MKERVAQKARRYSGKRFQGCRVLRCRKYAELRDDLRRANTKRDTGGAQLSVIAKRVNGTGGLEA